MQADKFRQLLIKHVPAPAVEYCFSLWQDSPFNFKLKKNRISKVGDFTCGSSRKPQITVNENLPVHLFLMTYVHEVAHHRVYISHGQRAEAHGAEWKKMFQQLMAPLLSDNYFPQPLLAGLISHMENPKASSFSDAGLSRLFRDLDETQKANVLISQIPEGSIFHLHGKWFTKGKLRRTRFLCNELKTKRQYLVPMDVAVENVQLSLL